MQVTVLWYNEYLFNNEMSRQVYWLIFLHVAIWWTKYYSKYRHDNFVEDILVIL